MRIIVIKIKQTCFLFQASVSKYVWDPALIYPFFHMLQGPMSKIRHSIPKKHFLIIINEAFVIRKQ